MSLMAVSYTHLQIRARENNTDTLVGVLSHIVEFRNGESGAHVRHIRIITEMLLHRLLEISNNYSISAEQQDLIPLASTCLLYTSLLPKAL